MYAVIVTGGQQLRVEVGDVVKVAHLPSEVGGSVIFDRVLMVAGGKNEGDRHLGKPTIAGNRLYMVDRQVGLVTIADITQWKNPKLIDQFEVPGNPSRVVEHHGVLVIPDGYNGMLVFDR